MILAGAVGGNSALAANASCDDDFRDVLKARAWMSAKREVETAERLILKADSVMEYTCHLDRIAGDTRTAANNFLNSNFGGNYAGGMHGNGGTCVDMSTIWHFLKCQDFDEVNFRTFSELGGADPRSFAPACNEADRANKWTTSIAAAAPAAVTPAASGGMDAVTTYLSEMTWLVAGDCQGVEPISTGVMANNTPGGGGTDYMDKVCPVPGCYFDPVNLAAEADDKCR